MIIHNIEQRSEAWHEIRLGRITGTSFQTLVSGESTKGYQDLILNLAGEILTGISEESYSNDIMERGIEFESDAAKEFSEVTGFELQEIGFITPDENTPYFEWIGVSPDRLIKIGGNYTSGLEIKCPLRKTHLRYINENRLPMEYVKQVQGALFVTKLPKWYFMSYYPGMKPFIKEVLPDESLFATFETRLNKIIPLIKTQIENYHKYDYVSI